MTTLTNSFEGGTDGVALTTGNSGGVSGDAFDVVVASGSYEYDTAITINDSVSALFTVTAGQSPFVRWSTSWVNGSTAFVRMYFRVSDATPTNSFSILNFYEANGSTIGADVQVTGSGHATPGRIRLRAPQTEHYVSTYTLSANTPVRLEVVVQSHPTTGRIQARLFYGANIDGTEPDEIFGSATANWDTGDGTISGAAFGVVSSPGQSMTMTMDDIGMSDADWLGPSSYTPTGAATLLDNNFEGGSDATTITTGNSGGTSGDAFNSVTSGGGSTKFDSDVQLHGTYTGLYAAASSYEITQWNTSGTLPAAQNELYTRHYFRVDDASPASSFTLVNFRESDQTTIGCDVRFKTTGNIAIRAADLQKAVSTTTIQAGLWYRLEVHVLSHASTGRIQARLFYGANLEGTTPDETIGNGTTNYNTGDATIGAVDFGFVSSPGQTMNLWADSIGVGSADWLGPVGAATPGPTGAATAPYWGMFAGNATVVAPPPTGGVASLLVPDTGAWFGLIACRVGRGESSNLTGYSEWMDWVNRRPHIFNIYKVGNDSGIFSSSELQMLDPVGGKHAIPHIHYKPGLTTAGNWTAAARGDYDTQIDNFGADLHSYGHPIFVTIFHEPEDNVGGSNTKTAYIDMWQRIRGRWDAAGYTNFVYVMVYMGYAGWAEDSIGTGFADLWPGDDYVDWISFNPYDESVGVTTLAQLLNQTVGGPGGWTGMYNWIQTYHSGKPIMISETGVDMNLFSDSAAATIAGNWDTNVATYTDIKAWCYYNGDAVWDTQVQNRPLFSAAIEGWATNTYFDQDGDLAL